MIGDAWTTDPENPRDKPWMVWDPDARKAIPIGLRAWLEDELGVAYSDHEIVLPAGSPLAVQDKGTFAADTAGTVLVKMKLADTPVYTEGLKYPFTVRVIGNDGFTRDDQTFYLLLKSQ